jgi:hypothetical protein
VLHVDGEMPAAALQERLASIARGFGAPTPPDGYWSLLAADLMQDGLPSLARPEVQAQIDEAMRDRDVLVLDNLSALTGGLRENEGDDWEPIQRWLMSLRRSGKLVSW